MKIYIGASTKKKFALFSYLVRWYSSKPYSHIYTRYQDPFTKQDIISESSHGEAHKILIDKWYLDNRIIEEYEIQCSEELFRAVLIRINQRLQAYYSFKNIIGVLIYDIGLHRLAEYFRDGEEGTICSESASFTLSLFGITFNRPTDFVRPDHIINKLDKALRTEDYIKKVLI